jgi:hypothetical protein
MTGNEMLAQLGQRMEDTAAVEYTSAIKLEALNNAQLRVSGLLPDNVLTELESLRGTLTVTAGAIAFSVIEAASPASTILNDRIQKVKITDGKFTNLISYDLSQQVQDNSYLTATTKTPYSWVHSESVYVLPAAPGTLDITYLRQPTAIAASATECELAKSLHETVLDLAEASLWLTANRADRSAVAENRALSFIKVLRGE